MHWSGATASRREHKFAPMRVIKPSQIAVFLLLLTIATAGAIATSAFALGRLPLGDFRGLVLFLSTALFFYVYSILTYRLFLLAAPLRSGEIAVGSSQEFIYHVYILFYLIVFYPVMRSGIAPAPLMRLFYLALGTRLGKNTYCQGIIHDPPFISIGANSTVGQSALIIPHVIEGDRLAHYPLTVGDNVTIGAHSVVLSDVTIGDGAIVAAGAVVSKGSRIGSREIWGGIPARKLQVH
jgi:acetyltransferase-like isoleucine patch superfamily enzyme